MSSDTAFGKAIWGLFIPLKTFWVEDCFLSEIALGWEGVFSLLKGYGGECTAIGMTLREA